MRVFAAGAVCPHPPLLARGVGDLDPQVEILRAACIRAVERILESDPARVVLVGDAPRQSTYGAGAVADFSPYGVGLLIPLGTPAVMSGPRLPLSLAIGAWLLHEVGCGADVTAIGVPRAATSEDAVALARAIFGTGESVAVLAMGDGSARRSAAAPGYVDGRAAGFDESVSTALGSGDTDAILALDSTLADVLLCAGRASWQVLAGAAAGRVRHADLLYDDAPFGVGYFVSTWTR